LYERGIYSTPTPIPTLLLKRLCRNSVHGSRTSPRTENDILKINELAVRPEHVEGRMANCDTVSKGRVIVTRFAQFLPFQGGGQAAGSESLWLGERGMGDLSECPLCPATPLMGKDQFRLRGDEGG